MLNVKCFTCNLTRRSQVRGFFLCYITHVLKSRVNSRGVAAGGFWGPAIPPSRDYRMIFFYQSNVYTYFFTFVINICENIITIIKFYLFVITRRKVLTVHITISSCLTRWSNWNDAGMFVSRSVDRTSCFGGKFVASNGTMKLTFYHWLFINLFM